MSMSIETEVRLDLFPSAHLASLNGDVIESGGAAQNQFVPAFLQDFHLIPESDQN